MIFLFENLKKKIKKKFGLRIFNLLKKIFRFNLYIFLFTIYLIPALFFKILNYRFPTYQTSRIGHIIDESETFIKEKKLGLINFNSIMLAPKNQIANIHALRLFNKYHIIILNPILCKILNGLRFHPLTKYDVRKYLVSINSSSYFHKINKRWGNRGSILSKSQIANYENYEKLRSLGVQKNSWYVCVHARDAGYSPLDEDDHKFRNAKIEDYYKSMDFIIQNGGYCIRFGDNTMKPIKSKDGYIDYAKSEFKSNEMDLFLAGSCRFFIGSDSGPRGIAGVFGVPIACANLAPLGNSYVRNRGDIGIPKLYKDKINGNLIKFSDIMQNDSSYYRHNEQFVKNNINLIDNSDDEILDLVKEQYFSITDQLSVSSEEEELQLKFRKLFTKKHYSYYSDSIISYSFLKKYRYLL